MTLSLNSLEDTAKPIPALQDIAAAAEKSLNFRAFFLYWLTSEYFACRKPWCSVLHHIEHVSCWINRDRTRCKIGIRDDTGKCLADYCFRYGFHFQYYSQQQECWDNNYRCHPSSARLGTHRWRIEARPSPTDTSLDRSCSNGGAEASERHLV